VSAGYIESIKKRESRYPTALPVEPYPIAIPHTAAEAIDRPFIAPLRLARPIAWRDMSDPDHTLNVRLVFMLGFKEPGAHIELLQILMHNFQRFDWVSRLYAARTTDEFFDVVLDMEWTHD
jgi:PTS system galactitol-specific IIA component